MHSRFAVCSLLAVAVNVAALAGSAPIPDGLRRCAQETDAMRRLACFDALVESLPKFETDQFGMTPEVAKRRGDTPEQQSSVPESRRADAALPATIAGLARSPDERWLLTFDNGQVWILAEATPGLRLTVGDKVQIEHGALGSLWLTTQRGRKLRVTRIR
jgi:hypothetical protein